MITWLFTKLSKHSNEFLKSNNFSSVSAYTIWNKYQFARKTKWDSHLLLYKILWKCQKIVFFNVGDFWWPLFDILIFMRLLGTSWDLTVHDLFSGSITIPCISPERDSIHRGISDYFQLNVKQTLYLQATQGYIKNSFDKIASGSCSKGCRWTV